eukprot:CAMPEP_0201666904 /NCGR_PEP_ID=MMETSP0494-20130426/10614_1 /ASSEMBLY_ACC=CAM_ASM_000839 /TAXON_ID=420259 /ORGANISM="Thalassiosira gravida, Strain GMp14c1" /LENGTH=170 /DNA_ID=CAMNT_0048146463 /DNA_START=27 /DNA_END=539 /DNA_ORIENTATION=+
MASSTPKNSNNENTPAADPPQPSELATIGMSIVGTFVAARCLAVISRLATFFAAPALGFYLFTTCPTNETFDGKKELKRVLRGDKLPEDDPNKPKGFFQKTMAKVSASIEAEAAALAGCKVEIMDLYGLVKVASIQHPMTKTAYFWLGAVNKWRFVMAKDFPEGEHSKKE